MLIRGESDEEKEIWVGTVLLLLRCAEGGDREREEVKFILFVEYTLLPAAVGDPLECVRMELATAQCGEELN